MTTPCFPEQIAENLLTACAVAAKSGGLWAFRREQTGFSLPYAERMPCETALTCAKRALREQLGAAEFSIAPIGPYLAGEQGGMLYFAQIIAFESPDSASLLPCAPARWSGSELFPTLFSHAQQTEFWDVRDREGRPTGRIARRGAPYGEGDYSLSVDLYLRNSAGKFLVQKRADCKKLLPGQWDMVCGMVQAGEDSRTAILRETAEEIGVRLEPGQLHYVTRTVFSNFRCFSDVWYAEADLALSDCVLRPSEVSAVRWTDYMELEQEILAKDFYDDSYRAAVLPFLRTKSEL